MATASTIADPSAPPASEGPEAGWGPPPDGVLAAARAQHLFRALADPIRLEVLQVLAQGERCVCDLTSHLDLGQSRLSFHLKVLKDAGLIAARQEGRWIYYRLQSEALEALRLWLGRLAAGCSGGARPCP